MKNKLTTLVVLLGYLLLLTTSCDKSEEVINGGDNPINGMDGVTVTASDPTIGYTTLELTANIENYEDSLEATAKFVVYDGEEVISEKSFTNVQNGEFTFEVSELTSGKEYQYDFSVIRGEDVVTTGKKKVSTQEVKTNFTVNGGFTSLRLNGALEGVLDNTKITIVAEVLSGETVVKTVSEEYDADLEGLEFVVPGLEMSSDYSSKVTVKHGEDVLSVQEENFKTYTFAVNTLEVSNNQGGLYMEGTFTSDIAPNDDLQLGFYYKKSSDAAYTWMDAEMKDETTLVAVGHGLDIGVSYEVKAAVKIVLEESEEVASEVKTLDDLHGGVFVDVAATGTGDGSSWENAFTKPQDAADAANTLSENNSAATVEILFKKGEYTETLMFEKNIFIRGSFNGDIFEKLEDRNLISNISIFKGGINILARAFESGNLCVDGFNFKRAKLNYVAGGIKIRNCTFYGYENNQNISGAAVDGVTNYSLPLEIENCNFFYDNEYGYSPIRVVGISTIIKNCNFKFLVDSKRRDSAVDFSVTDKFDSKLVLSNVKFDYDMMITNSHYVLIKPYSEFPLGEISEYLEVVDNTCKTGKIMENDILFDGVPLKDIIGTCNN
ncbi:hypothetical protein [Flammeovirga pacifica]|uniref:Right handed beta helix domain-containing protein n=1 Tax=Flammeovirga pacifica TaxID=915059 RepID=A0A1S1YUJ5_FLAPC|nr:hypothetical protein [Flammeovirga pacifica]OHX64485.1 hypothetical protein NH26_23175 [Flammeovirga pacifica]